MAKCPLCGQPLPKAVDAGMLQHRLNSMTARARNQEKQAVENEFRKRLPKLLEEERERAQRFAEREVQKDLIEAKRRADTAEREKNAEIQRIRREAVIHSLNPQTDLKADDLRRQLIEHVEDPSHLMRILEEKSKRAESTFERDVLKRLLFAGYKVTPKWKVGSYRIDLVVEGKNKRLAVECDGDRYHPLDKLGEDMERQAILERMGWIFTRIRGSEFFRDADHALAPVFAKLDSLEIAPLQRGSERATSSLE
jgi:very-short-patch-repair endonuclease